MQGSGILPVFKQIYAELSLPAVLSGREISQERSHILLYGTLIGLIIWEIFALNRETILQSECPDLSSNVQALKGMRSQLMSKDVSENELPSSRPFLGVVQKLKVFKKSHSGSKMSLLWLQYMHAGEIILWFMKSEWSSNSMLYLQVVLEMMPFFTTSGHHLYAKSIYVPTSDVRASKNSPRSLVNVLKGTPYYPQKW